jgi:hypothetical protein
LSTTNIFFNAIYTELAGEAVMFFCCIREIVGSDLAGIPVRYIVDFLSPYRQIPECYLVPANTASFKALLNSIFTVAVKSLRARILG